jgi:hypothetical protein
MAVLVTAIHANRSVVNASIKHSILRRGPTNLRKVIRYAKIQRSIGPIGNDINRSSTHGSNLHRVDGRDDEPYAKNCSAPGKYIDIAIDIGRAKIPFLTSQTD